MSDVSEVGLFVGTRQGVSAALPEAGFVMPTGGVPSFLRTGAGSASRAEAINRSGVVVGAVNLGRWGKPHWTPAIWRSPRTMPMVLADTGVFVDVNEAGSAVGYVSANGVWTAVFWNGLTSRLDSLPPLPGHFGSEARAVSIDNVVLGVSWGPWGGESVIWQWDGVWWKTTPLAGGINAYDIDNGYGVVGHQGMHAAFGDPDLSGYFLTGNWSVAEGVTAHGVATGWSVVPFVPQGPTEAFVADRGGNTEYLPRPAGVWARASGRGINSCLQVAGEVRDSSGVTFPAWWDPGC